MRRCKISNDEIPLPEPMIQHIQSFLTGNEAARTTVLSKSWYAAWLTRPTFDFDQRNFHGDEVGFAEATTKNMQRYQDSNMKIDSFRLRMASYYYSHSSIREHEILTNKLILSALEMGATDLDLELYSSAFVLPREVLESEHLVRLSLSKRTIDGNVNVRCWRLKSLSLHEVHLGSDDIIRDILSCCLLIEELSLSFCTRPSSGVCKNSRRKMIDLSGMNMFKLHKLRHLCLKKVRLDRLFFSDFGSRFPCLKVLCVSECCCYRWSEAIQIASTSLESISFVDVKALTAEFDVPNLVSFRYSGEGIPSLRIESSREWESNVSIASARDVETHSNSWYLRLKKLLTQLRPSNISLCISRSCFVGGVTDFKAGSTPLVVENLTIAPYCSGYTILSGLLSICRPKFLTIYWFNPVSVFADDNDLCKRVMKEIITPNCEISDQNMFGQLGLKEASAEVEGRLGGQWHPLHLSEQIDALTPQAFKRKLRFQLRWG